MADNFENKNSVLKSPRRGNPPRVRKRNRLFFSDDDETSYSPSRSSPRKNLRLNSPAKSTVLSTPDKKVAQKIGVQLRNLLKLPKAHKWVCYEWFYSNLDKPLFDGDNDFCICLRESFPHLKTRKLTRVEWCKIRRLMGKPRRCSSAFFAEERQSLQTKRNKIRLLQQRKAVDLSHFKDLPDEIPLPLVIGTKVTARLRKPQDGLFTGSIEAVDTSNATYRVTFDRQGLTTHSIPDYEVLSNEPQETMPISTFAQKHRPRNTFYSPPRFMPGCGSNNTTQLDNDPLLGAAPLKSKLLGIEGGTLGGFPIKFLISVIRLSKILFVKKEHIRELKDMNTQAEQMKSFQEPITLEFQRKYANIVLELDRLNKDLNEYLLGVQQYCQEIAPEQGLQPIDQTLLVRQRCEEEAHEMVKRISSSQGKKYAKNEKMASFVAGLMSLMLQLKSLAENDLNSFEFKSLSDSLKEIKTKLDCSNISYFQNNVEIHVNHIQSGLSQMGNLHAFASSHTDF